MFARDHWVLQIILEDMIESASDRKASRKGCKAKMSQAVSQRWISLCKMQRRVLERWDVLERFYLEQAKQLFPLKGRKDEVSCKSIQ